MFPELLPTEAAYYTFMIGMMSWVVEIGRLDIYLECSMMSSHLSLPQEGHIHQVFHLFAYLKKYNNTEMVYDPIDPVVEDSASEKKYFTLSDIRHVKGKEYLPPNMPQPRGLRYTMRSKVNAYHAYNTDTRRPRTGFIAYLNCVPLYWLSKKQTSLESSSLDSEFIVMKQYCKYLRGLQYKLRMMFIPVEGLSYILGDNQSVL